MWAKLKGAGKGAGGAGGGGKKGGGALKYRLLLQKDPDNVNALSKLGAIRLEAGEISSALKHLRKARELGLDTGTFWRTFGRALLQSWHRDVEDGSEDPEEAEDAVEAFENARESRRKRGVNPEERVFATGARKTYRDPSLRCSPRA